MTVTEEQCRKPGGCVHPLHPLHSRLQYQIWLVFSAAASISGEPGSPPVAIPASLRPRPRPHPHPRLGSGWLLIGSLVLYLSASRARKGVLVGAEYPGTFVGPPASSEGHPGVILVAMRCRPLEKGIVSKIAISLQRETHFLCVGTGEVGYRNHPRSFIPRSFSRTVGNTQSRKKCRR